MNRDVDWTLWRSFSAVVEHGSLSGAARAIGMSQPTLGRHIEALEIVLGVSLFERTVGGLRPTELALRLIDPVERARTALSEASMAAEGASGQLAGTVRLTSSTVACNYLLPPMLARLRQEFPEIALELVPSDSAENLLMREADIAVRMFRSTQLELVNRKLGQIPIVACASNAYLERRGTPKSLPELFEHDLIGFDRSDAIIQAARQMGFALNRDSFGIRCDSQTAMWELCKAGLGIGFAQAGLVRDTPGMVALLPDFSAPPLEVWLASHKVLFTSARIRAIYDRLGQLLLEYLSQPVPPPA